MQTFMEHVPPGYAEPLREAIEALHEMKMLIVMRPGPRPEIIRTARRVVGRASLPALCPIARAPFGRLRAGSGPRH